MNGNLPKIEFHQMKYAHWFGNLLGHQHKSLYRTKCSLHLPLPEHGMATKKPPEVNFLIKEGLVSFKFSI